MAPSGGDADRSRKLKAFNFDEVATTPALSRRAEQQPQQTQNPFVPAFGQEPGVAPTAQSVAQPTTHREKEEVQEAVPRKPPGVGKCDEAVEEDAARELYTERGQRADKSPHDVSMDCGAARLHPRVGACGGSGGRNARVWWRLREEVARQARGGIVGGSGVQLTWAKCVG